MGGGVYRFFLWVGSLSLATSGVLGEEGPSFYDRMQVPFMQDAPGRLFYPQNSNYRDFFAGVYSRNYDAKGLRVFRTPILHPTLNTLEVTTTAFVADKGPFSVFIGIADSQDGPVSGGGMMLQFARPPQLEGPGLFRMMDGLRHRRISFPMRYEDFSTDPEYSNMLRVRDLLFPGGKTKQPIIVYLQFSTTNRANPSLGMWVDDPSGKFARAKNVSGSPQEQWMTSGGGRLVKWDTGSRVQTPVKELPTKPENNKGKKEEARSRVLYEALLTESLKVRPTDKKKAETTTRDELWEKVNSIAVKKNDRGLLGLEISQILQSSAVLLNQSPATVKEAALLEQLASIKNPQSLPREFWRDSLNLFGTLLSQNNQRSWNRELFDAETKSKEVQLNAPLQSKLKMETIELLNRLLNDPNSDVSAAAQFLLDMQIENPAIAARIANKLAATSPFLRGKAAVSEIESITGTHSKTKMQVPRLAKNRIKYWLGIPAISGLSDTHRGLRSQMEKSLRTFSLEAGEYFALTRVFLAPESDHGKLTRMARELFLNPTRREKLAEKWGAELYPEIGVQTADYTAGGCHPETLKKIASVLGR